MAMERLAEQPIIDKTDESTKLLGSTQGLNDNGETVDTVRRIPFNLVAEALSKLGVFITVNESNIIGVTKNLGTFECVAIDDATNKYTFAVADTSIFVSSTEYKVILDDVDYIVRTSKINEDSVVFVGVDGAVPFEIGSTYTIIFETANAVALGKGNTVLAHNALGTGYKNKIDETGDQSVAFGYGNEVSGKNQLVTGYNHDVSNGEGNFVSGSSDQVEGSFKIVSGKGLTSILTSNGAAVLGQYNVDVEDAIFILGGGYDKDQRKNIVVVDRNGAILDGYLNINGDVAINGHTTLNGSEIVNLTKLETYTGINVGKEGAGYNAVDLNKSGGAIGFSSVVGGTHNKATNDQGVAFGFSNTNYAKNSLVLGLYNIINDGEGSVALGTSNTINSQGIALGQGLTVNGKSWQVVVGKNNETNENAVFIVGVDGNALEVLYDGTVVMHALTADAAKITDLEVTNNIVAPNIPQKSYSFTVSGEMVNENGETVALYENGVLNFSLNGGVGTPIMNCLQLNVPVNATLEAGVYKSLEFELSNYTNDLFKACNYRASLIFEEDSIIETDDGYIVSEDTKIDGLLLWTTEEDIINAGKESWYFTGKKAVLTATIERITNVTTGLIGAANKEAVSNLEDVVALKADKKELEALSKNSVQAYSNALKGSASGEVISLNDVTPVEHTIDVTVRSKNLVDISKWLTRNCIINVDGTVTSNINNTNYAEIYCKTLLNDILLANKGKTLTFSIAETLEDRFISLVIYAKKADGTSANISLYKKNANTISAVISEEIASISEVDLRFNWLSESTHTDTTTTISNIQLEISDAATEYVPCVDISKVTLSALGKNLVTYPYSKSGTSEVNDVTFTVKEDGSIVVNGTASQTFSFVFISPSNPIKLTEGERYTLSGCPEGGANKNGYYLAAQTTDYKTTSIDTGNGVTFTATVLPVYFYISIAGGVTLNNLVFRPQLELGESATEHEPYIEPAIYTPNADGTVEGVKSIYPSATLMTDKQNVVIDCEYNRDINKFFAEYNGHVNKVFAELRQAIISLGGNV